MVRIFVKIFSRLFLVSVGWILLTGLVLKRHTAISAKAQYLIFMKVLSYNRNLSKQVGDTLKIGIIFQKKYRPSIINQEEFAQAVKKSNFNKVNGIPITCSAIPYSEHDHLLRDITAQGIDVLYITPLRAISVDDILKMSRAHNLITITVQEDYCDAGVSTGLVLINNKIRIVINLTGAKAEGTDYSSQLLKLALIKK